MDTTLQLQQYFTSNEVIQTRYFSKSDMHYIHVVCIVLHINGQY